MEIDLAHPLQLPDIETLRDFSELSRIVLEVQEQVRREEQEQRQEEQEHCQQAASQPASPLAGGQGAEGEETAAGAEGTTQDKAPASQPFVLPTGVISRNEDYPRTCRVW